jgi:hypothetical protein
MTLKSILLSLAAQHSKDAKANAIANITCRLQALPVDLLQQLAVGRLTLAQAEESARHRKATKNAPD